VYYQNELHITIYSPVQLVDSLHCPVHQDLQYCGDIYRNIRLYMYYSKQQVMHDTYFDVPKYNVSTVYTNK